MVMHSAAPRKRQEAPGALELVRDFVNTRDLEHQVDALSDPAGMHEWLRERDLIGIGAPPVTEAEWRQAIEAREALRALALGNTGRPVDPGAPVVLNRLSGDADVRLRYRQDGTMLLEPASGGGPRRALGHILAIAGTAALAGTWLRLKVCPAEDCLWCFYDHSRNRSGTWCQMAECGNRAKARTYRDRHRLTPE
ncbi:CGNR zinc finger domain-containing protein [Spongiactinospora sp. TRM90649]|uniref:CGNR zinc finger domain-containing protein n=1 Tax=Spongiactinospora sp. TRM90649 TaxID=3031114 RepID=UPI0023FA3B4A|nr:CGNR zinc finger domain-containing protein [Spongiactinospora sp. TRM90649]MDF5753256.1 CGNR zinc finger domain-containing protein [Spongiactinospora sp. TRM90649]